MKKPLNENAKLQTKLTSQRREILALKKEITTLKKSYGLLVADYNDYLPMKEILTLMPGNVFFLVRLYELPSYFIMIIKYIH